MTGRTLRFALTRMRVWALLAPGLVLLVGLKWIIPGGILAVLGIVWLVRLATRPGLDQELLLTEIGLRFGVRRRLNYRERRAMAEILTYCDTLRVESLETELADETLGQAWKVVANVRGVDAADQLESFRRELPPLSEKEGLAERIKKDLERRKKIERELDLI